MGRRHSASGEQRRSYNAKQKKGEHLKWFVLKAKWKRKTEGLPVSRKQGRRMRTVIVFLVLKKLCMEKEREKTDIRMGTDVCLFSFFRC